MVEKLALAEVFRGFFADPLGRITGKGDSLVSTEALCFGPGLEHAGFVVRSHDADNRRRGDPHVGAFAGAHSLNAEIQLQSVSTSISRKPPAGLAFRQDL